MGPSPLLALVLVLLWAGQTGASTADPESVAPSTSSANVTPATPAPPASPAPATPPVEAVPAPAPEPLPELPYVPPPPHRVTASTVSLATPPPQEYPRSPPPPSTYVLPFQLRSVSPKTGVRIDTLVAPYQHDGTSALSTVVFVSGQLRLSPVFGLQARWGFDDNRVGNGEHNRTGIVNPQLGAVLAFPIGPLFRFAAATSVGLPLATGSDPADTDGRLLQRQAALARSAMDNNAFAPNDLGFPTGLSLAFVHRGVTAQIDGTIIPSGRVKGEGAQSDSAKVNSTLGFFLAYMIVPEFSLGAELRYQYYLLPPAIVDQDPSARDNLTAGAGMRFEIELSDSSRIRPGLCLSTGLAGYVEQQSFHMVQFDVPISF